MEEQETEDMTTELPPPRKLQRRGAFEEDVAGPRTALRQSSLELLANASASMDQKKEHALPRDLKRRVTSGLVAMVDKDNDTLVRIFSSQEFLHDILFPNSQDSLEVSSQASYVAFNPSQSLPATPRSNDGEYLDSQDSAVRELARLNSNGWSFDGHIGTFEFATVFEEDKKKSE
eukprot:g226.t1